ncbi:MULTISPECIES: methyl-accepting chemotaxis protein [Shewanella]|uniref:Methyl-accepting chemotaxis sensory transducer n=1 Tax=Shewanella baltica (strain OS195) TaxID=399599 RepID=A9KZI2_SHEB9|nr:MULTISPECIES: methyl-accepting chemotaxis protein [Shewanella]ABX47741.1 methyl-accepting chemotaxis sensory transducer [Shewanella baltica OS195]ADT92768.1 methyl-accepting chemotaxis sensory transducer [Shewanella baltica OS678]EHC04464.1 methyl-accepting chemotaxis sensory transducer [Shewanella baltica OS625]MCS6174924.1 methyl-accepting chemotaxis protein [Shewanella baltica]WAL79514.1 methyl-accepting chemotaxis protein [Shewanella sp. DAU305]
MNLKISTRIVVGICLLLLAMMSFIMLLVLSEFSSQVKESEQRELHKLYETAVANIASSGKLAQAMATIVSLTPEIQSNFAERDRPALKDRTLPLFAKLKQDFDIQQFQFHTPLATSFLRLHRPEKFGDDLTAIRKTIVETNTTKQPLNGLEYGVEGLGIRGLVPMGYQGQHTGSVEFGMSFGQPFFDSFKDAYQAEIALLLPNGADFKAFGATFTPDIQAISELNSVMQGNEVIRTISLEGKTFALYRHAIKDYSGQVFGVLDIAMDRSHSEQVMADIRLKLILIGFAAMLIGTAIAWFIAKGITRPIAETTQAMNDIAEGEGDLTRRITITSKDEIAELAQAFNRFVEKIHHTVTQVSDATSLLATSAEEMSGITHETQSMANRQNLETEQVATAMNEMAATVQEVAHNATDAADAANHANESTEQGKLVVQKVVATIAVLAEEIAAAANAINELERNTAEIDSVLVVIRNITEQTNLLALNAAIEAARAGEQGRGFAVVADEVRTLATRTQASTTEIQKMIEALQLKAKSTVSAMETSSRTTQSCVAQVNQAGEELVAITQAVSTISQMNIQIASAANEQCAVSAEINKNINNINDIATTTTNSAVHTARAGDELAQLAARLQVLLAQFRI